MQTRKCPLHYTAQLGIPGAFSNEGLLEKIRKYVDYFGFVIIALNYYVEK
jgi:hypothetical protein